jgi:Tfp pilus assembly protein PilP
MIKLHLTAEFKDAKTVEQARAKLDAFREAVQPAQEYGITIYEKPKAEQHLFIEQIARMTTQKECLTDTEDTINTLDDLILKARKLVGIHSQGDFHG